MTCPDCLGDPCRCAEWEEYERRAQVEEAEREAASAETNLDYLWETGPDGLLRRRRC